MSLSLDAGLKLGPFSTSFSLATGRSRHERALRNDAAVSAAASEYSRAIAARTESPGSALEALIGALAASSQPALSGLADQLAEASSSGSQAELAQLLALLGVKPDSLSGASSTYGLDSSATGTMHGGETPVPIAVLPPQQPAHHAHFGANVGAAITF